MAAEESGWEWLLRRLDLRVGWNSFQVGYAWFMMPMGQSWKRPSTLPIQFSILGTMIKPWEARGFSIFFSRISVDTARLRIWSRARSLQWALPSRMVLNSFVWSGKSSLCFRDLRPWDVSCEEDRSFAWHSERSAARDRFFSFHVGSFYHCRSVDWCQNQWRWSVFAVHEESAK